MKKTILLVALLALALCLFAACGSKDGGSTGGSGSGQGSRGGAVVDENGEVIGEDGENIATIPDAGAPTTTITIDGVEYRVSGAEVTLMDWFDQYGEQEGWQVVDGDIVSADGQTYLILDEFQPDDVLPEGAIIDVITYYAE